MKFSKGKSYLYGDIEQQVQDDEDASLEELGSEILGQHFVVVEAHGFTYSFVLTGSNTNGYVYECIFDE